MPSRTSSRKWVYPIVVILLVIIAVTVWYWRMSQVTVLAHLRNKTTTYTTYQGEMGHRRMVALPNQVKVLLNGNSRLLVPANFDQEHTVLLDGEAFFEAPQPFIVKTNIITIHAPAAAAFKVKCFELQPGATTYLYNGLVSVTKSYHSDSDNRPELLGKENNMLMANREIDLVEGEKYDRQELQTWLQDTLVFHNESFMKAMQRIGEWYATDVYVNGDATAAGDVNGTFGRMSMDSVLRALQPVHKFKYKVKKDRVLVEF